MCRKPNYRIAQAHERDEVARTITDASQGAQLATIQELARY